MWKALYSKLWHLLLVLLTHLNLIHNNSIINLIKLMIACWTVLIRHLVHLIRILCHKLLLIKIHNLIRNYVLLLGYNELLLIWWYVLVVLILILLHLLLNLHLYLLVHMHLWVHLLHYLLVSLWVLYLLHLGLLINNWHLLLTNWLLELLLLWRLWGYLLLQKAAKRVFYWLFR